MSDASDLVKTFGSYMKSEARSALQEVEIQSALFPTWNINLRKSDGGAAAPQARRGPGLKKQFARLVKPAVTVRTTMGNFEIAPEGKPRAPGVYFPVVAGAATSALALVVMAFATTVGQGKKSLIPFAVALGAGATVWGITKRTQRGKK